MQTIDLHDEDECVELKEACLRLGPIVCLKGLASFNANLH